MSLAHQKPHMPDLKIAMLMDQSLERDLFSKLMGEMFIYQQRL